MPVKQKPWQKTSCQFISYHSAKRSAQFMCTL